MAYDGPDRRAKDSDIAGVLAEIKTDVKWIVQALPNLATNERVSAVESKLDTHIDNHIGRASLFVTWAGVAVALAVGVLAVIR